MKKLLTTIMLTLGIGNSFSMNFNTSYPSLLSNFFKKLPTIKPRFPSKLFQRLQEYGIKKLGIPPLPSVEDSDHPMFALFTYTTVNQSGIRKDQIFATPKSFKLPYGIKKGAIFHELIHVLQPLVPQPAETTSNPAFPYKLLPLNNQYPHIETEADMEGMKLITCWKCAHELLKSRPRKASLLGIISNYKLLLELGYASYEQCKPIAEEKRKADIKCPYHQELSKNKIYLFSHFIVPIFALGSHFLTKAFTPSKATIALLSIEGALIGNYTRAVIRKVIEKKLEDRVASGELEP